MKLKLLTTALLAAAVGTATPAAAAPSVAPTCTVSRTLAHKATGSDVNCLETRLRDLGHQSSYVDTYYGTVTISAVQRFQTSVSLPSTGTADPTTLSALGIWLPPPPAPACAISATVRAKETSAAVSCVEQTLRRLGFQSSYIDSYYGTVTVSAVANFQRSVGLPVNGGVVDYATGNALGIWLGPPPPPPPPAPAGCLIAPANANAAGLFINNPNKYQTIVATSEAGSRGPIIVIGDSLTWQSAQETATQLRASGWGPVCVQGTIAASVQFGNTDIPDGLDMIARVRGSNPQWNNPNVKVVVALGTNDVGFSGTSLSKAKSYVANMLSAIGPTTQPVSWMTVRTERSSTWMSRENVWNQAVAESGVHVLPWAGEFSTAWCGSDLVHLTSAGKTARVSFYGRI